MKKLFLGLMFILIAFSWAGADQHDYVIANAPGASVRADINSVLQAIVSLNAGATAPATTYPNMWWYDTSTSLLKRRNNANNAWITTGLESASTDGTFAANSDSLVPTQKAAKTYADNKAAKGANSDITSLSGLTTPLSRAQGGLASTVANNTANGPVFLDGSSKLPAVDGSQLTGISGWTHSGTQVYSGAAPTSFTDLNLSAYVGSTYSLVFLRVYCSGVDDFTFRTNGETQAVGFYANNPYGAGASGGTVEATGITYIMVETDASGIIEWKNVHGYSTTITLMGYIQ